MATRRAAQPCVRANKGVASIVPLSGAPAAATFDVKDLAASGHGARVRPHYSRVHPVVAPLTPWLRQWARRSEMVTNETPAELPEFAEQLDRPLFKFRGFDREKDLNADYQGYAASLLRDGLIYCASPFEMNDPWEGRPAFTVPNHPFDHPACQAFVDALLEGHAESERKGYRELLEKTGLEFWANKMQDHHREMHRGFGIFSMSTDCTHPLQWGYYGSGHRGFCWILDHKVAPFARAVRVDYADEHPHIDFPNWKKGTLVKAAFQTKARHWQHEGEYRILLPQTKAPAHFTEVEHNGVGKKGLGRYLKVPTNAIIGIIFGNHMPHAEAGTLIRLAREFGRKLEFGNAVLHRRKFEMAVKELDRSQVEGLSKIGL
jgi:hypothetical protein